MRTIKINIKEGTTHKKVVRHLVIFGDDYPDLLTWRELKFIDPDFCDYTYVCRVEITMPEYNRHSEVWRIFTRLAVEEAKKQNIINSYFNKIID